MTTNTEHFKNLLTKEAENLEIQLAGLGRKNPDRPGDWETTRKETGTEDADELDVSEEIETYDNNNAVLSQLEIQLKNVKEALAKIEDGTYGKCNVCGESIEEDRLEADPSAITCKSHMS